MPNKPTTIRTFDNSIQATLVKNHLIDEGIAATLSGENLVATNWALSNAVGGIRLQVPEDDVARAKAILEAEPASEIEPDDEAEPTLTKREEDAERAFRGSIIGVVCPPIQLYVFYLLLRVYVSDEELRGRLRSRAKWAAVINIPVMLAMGTVLRAMIAPR
jgi:hypothetical protein